MLTPILRRLAASLCLAGIILQAPSTALAAGGNELWLARYDGPDTSSCSASPSCDDIGMLLAVGRGGGKVFVAGQSVGAGTNYDFVTLAYDASTGAKLWEKRYDGPRQKCGFFPCDSPRAMALSPDGKYLLVTGESMSVGGNFQFATVAYNSANGAQLWVRRYGPAANFNHFATAVAISPDSTRVYVSGKSGATTNSKDAFDIATIAYSASVGETLWVNRYHHTANGGVEPSALTVSPDGTTVFATGDGDSALTTIAYNSIDGTRRWVKRDLAGDYAHALGISPDGSRIFVAGRAQNFGGGNGYDYLTVAYNAATGAKAWARRYNGAGTTDMADEAQALAVSPDGSKVFVTGASQFNWNFGGCDRYATVAYATSGGARLWVNTWRPTQPPDPGCYPAEATAIAASPDGQQVFVTGRGTNCVTIGYAAASGARQWLRGRQGGCNAVGVSPDSSRVFVTGATWDPTTADENDDILTIGYGAH